MYLFKDNKNTLLRDLKTAKLILLQFQFLGQRHMGPWFRHV
jgi:hypothetical protein